MSRKKQRPRPKNRNLVENAIFSQYPDAELHEVEDYTKRLPQVLPNAEYDLFGADFTLQKEDAYPIRTYIDLEDINVKEEEDKIFKTLLLQKLNELARKIPTSTGLGGGV